MTPGFPDPAASAVSAASLYNRAEPGPRVGVSTTMEGPRGSGMRQCQGGTSVIQKGNGRWTRGRGPWEGLLGGLGGLAERRSTPGTGEGLRTEDGERLVRRMGERWVGVGVVALRAQ